MDTLTYFLALIVSFLGLIIGIILSNIAVEEISGASRYLKHSHLLFVPVAIFMASFRISMLCAIIASCIILACLIAIKNISNQWIYACMGAILYVSTISKEIMNVSILIFLYGICISTVMASGSFEGKINSKTRHADNLMLVREVLRKYSYYLLVGIIFYISFTFII